MSRPAMFVLVAALIAMGITVVTGAGRLLTPEQYLQLMLAYELSNTERQPVDRCTPDNVDDVTNQIKISECNLYYGSVPFRGSCYALLKQGPCYTNQWLVMDKYTERPTCQFKVCPKNHVLVEGECAVLGNVTSSRYCRKTLKLIINEYGEAECECPIEHVYYPRTGRCYALYEQGPCRNGYSLQIVDSDHGSFADCLPSLCAIPGQVPMTPLCQLAKAPAFTLGDGNYQCYNKSSQGPCSSGILSLDLSLMDVVCRELNSYGIFDSLPGRPCSRGSRRDSLGRCRRELDQSGSPDVTTMPPTVRPGLYENGTVCPDDYVFLSGTCMQIVSGT